MKKSMILAFVLFFNFSATAQEFDLSSLAQERVGELNSAEYDAAFEELDADKNGYLSEQELLKFQEIGLANEKDETYKIFDADNNSKVDEEEYKAFFNNKAPQNVGGADLSLIFRDMDADNDGNLSPEELKNYRQKNLDAQNREIFRLIDVNNDDKITKDEFAKFMALTKSILGNIQDF